MEKTGLLLVLSALVVTSVSQISNRTITSLLALSNEPLSTKYPPLSPFLNFGPTHKNRPGPQSGRRNSDFSAGLLVDSTGKLGGHFEFKRPGFGVKTTGTTDFNGDNNFRIGLNIPLLGRKSSRSWFGRGSKSRSTSNFKSPWNDADQ